MSKKRKNKKHSFIPAIIITGIALAVAVGLHGYMSSGKNNAEAGNLFGGLTLNAQHKAQNEIKLPPLAEMTEVPAVVDDEEILIVRHYGYTLAYHKTYKIPHWVAWKLTADRVDGRVKRGEEFMENPLIPARYRSVHGDYSGSKYDRGHMVPSGDMKWDKKAMEEAFYMSNMCPQAPNLNRGDWRLLEEKCRVWAKRVGDLYIACGPIVEEGKWHRRIGRNKVTVPDGFFKVVLTLADDRPRAIGFIYPNDDCNAPIGDYAVSVDSVEAVTGIDFFATLPDELEDKVEQKNAYREFR